MLTIVIKNLKIQMTNSNLLMRKNAICFEVSNQKRETDKQTADAIYYKY